MSEEIEEVRVLVNEDPDWRTSELTIEVRGSYVRRDGTLVHIAEIADLSELASKHLRFPSNSLEGIVPVDGDYSKSILWYFNDAVKREASNLLTRAINFMRYDGRSIEEVEASADYPSHRVPQPETDN